MGDSSSTAPASCPACGQQLLLSTMDLAAEVACPRCRTRVSVAALVPSTTPLPALVLAPPSTIEAVPGPASVDEVPAPATGKVALVRGADAAHDVGARLAGWAIATDAMLEGKRGAFLVGGAVVTTVSLQWPLAYAVALPLYAALLWVVLVARLWSLRDADGRWTLSAALERAGAAATDVAAGVRSLLEGAWTDGCRRIGVWLLGLGTIGLTVALPCEQVLRKLDWLGAAGVLHTIWITSVVAAVAGGVTWTIGWDAQRRSRLRFQAAGPVSTLSLPVVVDLKRDGVPAAAPQQLKPLLEALRSWNPRPRSQDTPGQLERAYEDALVRHLRRSFKDAQVDQQAPMRVRGATAAAEDARSGVRFDIVFQDSIVLELKVSLKGRSGQDALGQVRKYARVWDRGPILVVSCESSDGFAESDAAASFGMLRREGMNVAVLAAGRRAA